MEVTYKRDLNHNYIRVRQEHELPEYQARMITRNHIEGLMDCREERIDDQRYFLYEISSKQPFTQVYEKQKMDYQQFMALINCVQMAVTQAKEYMLDLDYLVLEPDYIYLNPESRQVCLLFLPGRQQNIKQAFHELTSQLLGWIDYKEEQVVTAAYDLFRCTAEDNYTLEEALNSIAKKEKSVWNVRKEKKNQKGENIERQTQENSDGKETDGSRRENTWLPDQETRARSSWKQVLRLTQMVDRRIWMLVGLTVPVLLAAGYFLEFPVAFSLLCVMIAVVVELFFFRKRENNETMQEWEEESVFQETEKAESFDYEEDDNGLNRAADNVQQWQNIEERPVTPAGTADCAATERGSRSFQTLKEKDNQTKNRFAKLPEYGNTVFFPHESLTGNKRLIALSKPGFQDFEMQLYPFIIGKLREAVDGVLEDESVSRIHAKVDKVEADYYICDLNSTNGTFLNDRILNANERARIQPGDCLRFGHVQYRFE